MRKQIYKTLSIFGVLLLLSQTLFGSLPVFAMTNSNTTSALTITMVTNGQPYIEGDIATSPVTIQVAATSPDSASIQVEISQDLGATWQTFDAAMPLILQDAGDYDIWFKATDAIGQIVIEKRRIQITPVAALLLTQTTSVTTPASAVIYVNETAQAGGDGTSWVNAYQDLQTALTAVIAGQEIWIAKGTYKPTAGTNQNASFQMKNGVAIYGGFNGIETTLAERDYKANETILSGDIGVIGNNNDNTYHVFYHPSGLGLNDTAILDGVTITGGNAGSNYGGGMHNNNNSPKITNVTFTKNHAGLGGGMMNNNGSNPILTNIIFSENTASRLGGGINNWHSNPVLTNVTFNGNRALSGGGIHNESSNLTLMNATFSGNTGTSIGGGIHNIYSSLMLTSATFNGNVANDGGGIYNNSSSSLTLTNITISGNTTNGSNKAAIYNGSNVKIRNSIIVGNNGPAIGGSSATIEHSLLGDHEKGKLYDGTGTPGVDDYKIEDIFIHPDLANSATANYRLKAGSPAIDKGVSTYPELAQITKDLDGNDRIRGTGIDLGAYESLASTFTVSYDGNGATGGQVPVDNAMYETNNSVTVSDNTGNLEKTGFTFTGWNTQADGGGTSYTANATFQMGTTNVTLYAQWTANPTFTVNYDENGATGGQVPVDNAMYETNNSVPVLDNTGNLEKTGFTFTGWNTQADGGGTSYTANATFQMGTTNVTLYAQWTANPTFTVNYDKNGATGGQVPVDNAMYETNNSVTVLDNTGNLEKTGFTFTGWNTQADGGGTSYTANATFQMGTTNVTLYAQWDVARYTLSFESNGGSAVPTQQIFYNHQATIPAVPIKVGYTFFEWYTDAALTKVWDFKKDTVKAPTTLYAKWVANSYSGGSIPETVYTLSFESNGGSTITTRSIISHYKVTEPSDPIKEGYTFAGWYTDAALTKAWDFTKDFITGHTTLYAKWIVNRTSDGDDNIPVEPPLTPEEPEPPQKPLSTYRFTDISKNWARDMIEDMATQGVITGYPDGTFRPNAPIQRQHVAIMFARAFELTPKRATVPFSDVSTSHPYYEAITLLQQAGIVDGANGAFKPNAPMTRAQMAKVIVLAFGLTPGGTSTFNDVPPTHWSYDYIAALENAGISLGDNGNFKPDEPVTRAQFVAFMYRAMNR
ncbi:InlB B-repeat-containing protein [Lysinibacillus sp. LZ02]|uniref:InlB B-repeat-containing protein n=1 Tax=Lysinibacillus sp. LZ02 TaxID=3420668 RepID=UPI003D368A60